MKKIIALSVAIIYMGTASAQQMTLKKSGYFKPIPGYATNDGKGRLIAIDDNDEDNYEFTIINTALKDETHFTASAGYHTEVYYKEAATKDIISMIKVEEVSDSEGDYVCHTSEFVTDVNSSETLAQALKQKYSWNDYAPYKLDGYDICVVRTDDKYATFIDYEQFGEAFPHTFYTIKDGSCVSIYRRHVLNTNDLQEYIYNVRYNQDSTGLTFNKVEGSDETHRYSNDVIGMRLYSIDKGEGNIDVKNTYATQSILNNDGKWEYLIESYDAKYGEGGTPYYSGYYTDLRYGILTVEREVYAHPDRPNCTKIMSQDGTCLGTIAMKVDEGIRTYIIGGKPYFVCYGEEAESSEPTEDLNGDGVINEYDKNWIEYAYLYSFDGTSDGITLVEKTPTADNRAFNIAGQRIALSHKGIVIKNGKKVLNK